MIRVRKTVALIIAVCLFVTSFAVTSLVAGAVSNKFISGASLNLNNGFSINFYAPVGKLESYDRAVLEVQFRDRGDALQTVELEPGVEQVYFDGEYHKVFSFNNIAPDRFADTVTATIYGVKGVDAPIQLEESFVYSVKQYVENIYEDTTQESNPLFGNRKLKTLLADILVYGEKARDYTGLGADFVMSDWVAENASSGVVANTAESSVKKIEYLPENGVTSSNDEVKWSSVGLNLRENASILYRFKLNARAGRISDYYLMIETGKSGEEISLSVDNYNKAEKCYEVYFRGLNPTQMGKTVTAYFVNSEYEVVSSVLTYSVESFANYCYNKKAAVGNELYELTQALIRFGNSTERYFGEDTNGSGALDYANVDSVFAGSGLTMTDDVSSVFNKNASSYLINGGTAEEPYLVDAETIRMLTTVPVTGTGYVKWINFDERGATLGNTDRFNGVVPVSKLSDPVFMAMNLPAETTFHMVTQDNRINPINMSPLVAEHTNMVSIGAIYKNDDYVGGIADDDKITVCISNMQLLVKTTAEDWHAAIKMNYPTNPRLYPLPWKEGASLDFDYVDKGTYAEYTITGAMLNGVETGTEAATLHFWSDKYWFDSGADIQGCVGSYVVWVKDAEDVGKVVATIGVDVRTDTSTDADQAFAGYGHTITSEPRLVLGHNVGPKAYDTVMNTNKVQQLLGLK